MNAIYQEQILDHFHNPRNNGTLKNPTHAAEAHNPTCGDTLRMELCVNEKIIEEIKFAGDGCAISQAAASLLTEEVQGQKTTILKNFDKTAMLNLLGIELSPVRLKCGLLALECAQKALDSKL